MAGPLLPTSMQRLVQALMGVSAPRQPPVTVQETPPSLPAFQMPGQDFAKYMPPVMPTMPATTIAAPRMAPAVPQPQPASPIVSDAMPEMAPAPLTGLADVKQDVAKALADMQRRNLLPEQWRGAFGNQYGEPT